MDNPNTSSEAPQVHATSRRKKDRSNENITKNWKTLVNRGIRLQRKYGATVHFSIEIPYRPKQRPKKYLFQSGKGVSPLLMCDMEKQYPPPVVVVGDEVAKTDRARERELQTGSSHA
ncbi:hypothetical protein PG985_004825 [Apiospora marii]|uniref:uncharacterized protein n=1 Tax=Apiospora marii TaxID=335849 RepID=UPI00312F52DD